MSALYSDTDPKVEALQIKMWRQASPTRKMHMLAQLNASVRILALAGLRSRYPNATETELRRRLADLLLGEELARKVYGEMNRAE
ncbi:MAG TPA: hypothetical protein VK897_01210 [Anaerolineales bacterium]|jgi:hypothetical protein|nr:hypothetical protein [Anaerolineales bacterium]